MTTEQAQTELLEVALDLHRLARRLIIVERGVLVPDGVFQDVDGQLDPGPPTVEHSLLGAVIHAHANLDEIAERLIEESRVDDSALRQHWRKEAEKVRAIEEEVATAREEEAKAIAMAMAKGASASAGPAPTGS